MKETKRLVSGESIRTEIGDDARGRPFSSSTARARAIPLLSMPPVLKLTRCGNLFLEGDDRK